MMTALLLARQGVKCLVLERKPGISTHPKAMGVSRRTAELYRQLGLLDEIEKGSLSREGRWLALWSKTLVGEELGRVPIVEAHSPTTPCVPLHCPQTWTEQVLWDALKK
jgi:2-polyprenyl-6-methoxyphenol hydroxylase-like FAD-dependent oxidoreductase